MPESVTAELEGYSQSYGSIVERPELRDPDLGVQ